MKFMKAMLLAAGLGTRLRPLTDAIPKPLIPINGIPLICYNLALLKKYGITDVVINLHYKGEQIRQLLGDGLKWGMHFEYSMEPEILGTGGGIKKAEAHLKNGPFFVLNADIIIDIDLKAMEKTHTSQGGLATIAVIESPLSREFGTLYVDADNRLISILEKPSHPCTFKNTFFTGVHLLESRIFDLLPAEKKLCIIRDGYIPALKGGQTIGAYLHIGYWNDAGTVERLKKAEEELKKEKKLLSFQRELEEFRRNCNSRMN